MTTEINKIQWEANNCKKADILGWYFLTSVVLVGKNGRL